MKSVSKPLPNPFAVGAVILTCLILLAGCSEGGGGGRVEKICEDYCEALNSESCGGVPGAVGICVDECIQNIDDAEEIDGKVCADAQLTTFECITEEECEDRLAFFSLSLFDLKPNSTSPQEVCRGEIDTAVLLCENSLNLPEK
ncbi:MAG TPA: hypothetical protein EYQ46_07375 [Myxococcales bacterium]|nr:hypothetical protein [Myxococcales bacterium]